MKKVLVVFLAAVAVVAAMLLGVGTAYSGKATVKKSVTIEQKPEHVFASLVDPALLPDLGIGVTEVKLPAGAKLAAGMKFELVTEYGPAEALVTRFEENQAFACDVTIKGQRVGNLEFELTPGDAAGTELQVELHVESKPPLGGLYNIAAKRAAEQLLEANQETIKTALGAAK